MTENSASETTQLPHRNPAVGTIVALVLVSAIGNFGGTLLFWELPTTDTTAFLLCCSLGLMLAQPCALAVWCAMGSQARIVRIPLTMGILFCLLCQYAATLHALDTNLPLEVTLIIIVGAFVLTALIQVPLWIFRFKTGFKLSLPGAARDSEEKNQFGIKHLLMTTTIAAVIIAVCQSVLKSGELEGGAPWGQILGYLVTFELFISIITLLSFASVFSRAGGAGIGCLLGLVVGTGPFAVSMIVDSITGAGGRLLLNTFGFTIVLTTALTVVLQIFQALGYRLQRSID